MVEYTPKRGDVVWLDFDPQKGKEIRKTRPALVISPYSYNHRVGLALCMPITSKSKGYPFEVPIDKEGISGVVLSDHIRPLDWRERNAKFITHLPAFVVEDIISRLQVLLT